MFEPVDLYCERTDPGLWSEPVNATTNLAFLVAAWAASRFAKGMGHGSRELRIMLLLTCAIGLGSGLFHTVANGWTRLIDIVPILLFQLLYLWVYLRYRAGMDAVPTTGLLAGYLLAAIAGREFPEVLNGSLIYAPAIASLILISVWHAATRLDGRLEMVFATVAFSISLTFRTLDATLCPVIQGGTHFLWHLLNALTLYLLMKAYLLSSQQIEVATSLKASTR